MTKYAALDVSMEETIICAVDENGGKAAEEKVLIDPDAIADWLALKAGCITIPLGCILARLPDPGDLPRLSRRIACAAARLWNDNAARLRKSLRREPTARKIYLTHQQGLSRPLWSKSLAR